MIPELALGLILIALYAVIVAALGRRRSARPTPRWTAEEEIEALGLAALTPSQPDRGPCFRRAGTGGQASEARKPEARRFGVREVEQTHVYDGAGNRGNCVAACVASVFGLPLWVVENQGIVPGSGFQDVAKWTSERWPTLEYREQDFCTNHRCVKGDGHGGEEDRWEYDLPDPKRIPPPPTCGLWIAHVVSPRGLLRHGPYRGMPVQHAVVMRGGTVVWDPHPQRDQGVGQRVGMGWWVVRDPGELVAWKFCWGMLGAPSREAVDDATKYEEAAIASNQPRRAPRRRRRARRAGSVVKFWLVTAAAFASLFAAVLGTLIGGWVGFAMWACGLLVATVAFPWFGALLGRHDRASHQERSSGS